MLWLVGVFGLTAIVIGGYSMFWLLGWMLNTDHCLGLDDDCQRPDDEDGFWK